MCACVEGEDGIACLLLSLNKLNKLEFVIQSSLPFVCVVSSCNFPLTISNPRLWQIYYVNHEPAIGIASVVDPCLHGTKGHWSDHIRIFTTLRCTKPLQTNGYHSCCSWYTSNNRPPLHKQVTLNTTLWSTQFCYQCFRRELSRCYGKLNYYGYSIKVNHHVFNPVSGCPKVKLLSHITIPGRHHLTLPLTNHLHFPINIQCVTYKAYIF